jgi:hypothetical protein
LQTTAAWTNLDASPGRSFLEQPEKVSDRANTELDLDEQLRGGTPRCLTQPSFVHD